MVLACDQVDVMSDAPESAVCQECGGKVRLEVEWGHFGINAIYGECRGCGMDGWTDERRYTGMDYAQEKA